MVGLPLQQEGKLYNCAAFLAGGHVLGIVPKTYLPNTQEYYEGRWFTSSRYARFNSVNLDGQIVPFGADLLFQASNLPGCVVGVEICEDLWAINAPSSDKALGGATILLNPSASDDTLSKGAYRTSLVTHQSGRCLAAYLYAGASPNESTTDVVFAGHSLIAEYGTLLAEGPRFQFENAGYDRRFGRGTVDQRATEKRQLSTQVPTQTYRRVDFALPTPAPESPYVLQRPLSQTPFVPSDPAQRGYHCPRNFRAAGDRACQAAQTHGGQQRRHWAFGWTGFDAGITGDYQGVRSPGLGSQRDSRDFNAGVWYNNAHEIERGGGWRHSWAFRSKRFRLRRRCANIFATSGIPKSLLNVVFENAQARERTQILMDTANQINGLVVGTGDLSELALGWATYNGDQMSMYHVNGGAENAGALFGGVVRGRGVSLARCPKRCSILLTRRSRRSCCHWTRRGNCNSRRRRPSVLTCCMILFCFTWCATNSRRAKSFFSRSWHSPRTMTRKRCWTG